MPYTDPFIKFFTFAERGEQCAVLGFSLPSNSSGQARKQASPLNLINALWRSGVTAVDLRLARTPAAPGVNIALLCHFRRLPQVENRAFPAYCLAASKSIWQLFSEWGFELHPLSDKGSLAQAILPFQVNALAEMRRAEEIFVLWDPEAYTENDVYVPYPWEWSRSSPLTIFEILAQQPGCGLVSIHLKPTQLSAMERAYLDYTTTPRLQQKLRSAGMKGSKTADIYQMFALKLEQPYLLRISLAASDGRELTHLGQALLTQLQAALPPPILQFPQNEVERQSAWRNFSQLEWLPWGNLYDGDPKSGRLRYLIDSQGASMAFQPPIQTAKKTRVLCIVCALPEEARAFLKMVQPQCEGAIEERISPRHGYPYRSAILKNGNGEPLNLHISWLPWYGPEEMTLHLSRVLEEYKPRIAIMTGICAGYREKVQLGDLVVADRTFTYDNGKFTTDEKGNRVHAHDTMTYQLDANIIQFLGMFDAWEPLVANMDRPSPEHRKTICHIKSMASGSAVRADNPFEDVRVPVRDTVAIDMEGAAFGLVMSRHPQIPWLVVKGVCDYADGNKNDSYHDYAGWASAIYALSFIRAYMRNER